MTEQLAEAPVVQSAQPPVADPEVERLKAHNSTLVGEKRRVQDQLTQVQAQLKELQEAQEATKTSQLADSGDWKTLWEQQNETVLSLKSRITELEKALTDATKQTEVLSLRAQVTQALSGAVINPEQLFRLEPDTFRPKDGQPVALVGGVEMSMGEYIEHLRKPGSGYEHHCRPMGASGMGSGGSSALSGAAAATNPYIARNMTAAIQLELANPQLAERLKAEAGL